MRTIRALALCLVAGLLLPDCCWPIRSRPPIRTWASQRSTRTLSSPRPEAVHILEIDLTAPGIHFEMSPATPPNPPQSGDVTTVQKTLTYMNSVNAQFAINTEFFVNPPHANMPRHCGVLRPPTATFTPPSRRPTETPTPSRRTRRRSTSTPLTKLPFVTRNTSDSSGMTVAQPVTIGNAVLGTAEIITNGQDSIPTYAEAGGVLTDGSGYSSSNSWYANNHLAARSAMGSAKTTRRSSFLPWTTTPTTIARG